ncbi:hypothetical protein EVAR_12372_1 [Eumeta japonica]|uniref:Uncharacterized protein n=1 Tax=Eumeta variegata TaxID=151549 RepID=A0A4C1X0K6_EUMVA|nr:hypothetical protein EVAR_12372_1 [Eumeta japonica]
MIFTTVLKSPVVLLKRKTAKWTGAVNARTDNRSGPAALRPGRYIQLNDVIHNDRGPSARPIAVPFTGHALHEPAVILIVDHSSFIPYKRFKLKLEEYSTLYTNVYAVTDSGCESQLPNYQHSYQTNVQSDLFFRRVKVRDELRSAPQGAVWAGGARRSAAYINKLSPLSRTSRHMLRPGPKVFVNVNILVPSGISCMIGPEISYCYVLVFACEPTRLAILNLLYGPVAPSTVSVVPVPLSIRIKIPKLFSIQSRPYRRVF